MIEFISRAFCPLFVLSFGLVSCNRTIATDETFRVPEPVWETRTEKISFRTSVDKASSHALTDILSFENSPPLELKVRSRCLQGSETLAAMTTFQLPAKLPLYSLLSPRALAPARFQQPEALRCTIDFRAQSSHGSVHLFRLPIFAVTDNGAAAGIAPVIPKGVFQEDELANVRFFISSSDELEVSIFCGNDELKNPRIVRGDIWLNDFDFGKIANLRTDPNKHCRLVGLKKGVPRFLSAPFEIQFHPPPRKRCTNFTICAAAPRNEWATLAA